MDMDLPLDINDLHAAATRLAPYIFPTPLLKNHWLSKLSGKEIYIKWECFQNTGSFKLRGALNKLLPLKAQGITQVVAISAGNHGLGVAYAAQLLGLQATIVVPKTAAPTKVQAMSYYGVEILARGDNYDEAELWARKYAEQTGLTFVSPYNDLAVIAGQATIALEMCQAQPLDLILASVGGGGLLAGVALATKLLPTTTDVIGVQPANSTAMQTAFHAGKIVPVTEQITCADGLMGNLEAGTITFPLVKALVKEIITVPESIIEETIFRFAHYDHAIVEGSGAVAAAAIITAAHSQIFAPYNRIGIIVSGRNIDLSRLHNIITKYSSSAFTTM